MAEVLVVEDDDTTRILLEACLHRAGHVVRTASSAAGALADVRRRGVPQVLVSDMFMPEGSGVELVAGLRRAEECRDLPVVFVSGRALPGDVQAGRALGAAYLSKPVQVPALLAAVDDACAVLPDTRDGHA